MPRKPTLLGHPREAEVRKLRADGWSLDKISARLNLPRNQVQTFCTYIQSEANGGAPLRLAPPPEVPADATPRQRAELHANWLKAQIDGAIAAGANIKELASLSGQYVNAMRLVARLSGALEITAAQILRSTDFQRCIEALRRAAGDNLEVLKRLDGELARLMGEG